MMAKVNIAGFRRSLQDGPGLSHIIWISNKTFRRVSVASMKPLQCVALVAVLIQSLSVVDAGARDGKDARSVLTTIAGEAANENATTLKVDRLDAGIDTIVPANATMERVATGFT